MREKIIGKLKIMLVLLLSVTLTLAFALPAAATEQTVSATENPYKGYKLSPDKFYYRESTVFDGKAVIANYVGTEVYVPVPSEIDGMAVNQLSISGCNTVQELYLPDSIEIIDSLSDCENLTTIHFPSSIDMIDAWFSGDTKIKHLYIPSAITYISPDAFVEEKDGQNAAMTGLVIHGEKDSYAQQYAEANNYEFVESSFATSAPEQTVTSPVSEWSYSVQNDNTAVINGYSGTVASTMSIPDDVDGYEVSGIGKAAFKGGLEGCRMVILPESIVSIDVEAFEGCEIESIYFSGDSLKRIDAYAFAECESLTSVEIPDGTEEIGYNAFADCKSLRSLTVPKSVLSIKDGAFDGCDALTNISTEDGSYAEKYFADVVEAPTEEADETEAPVEEPATKNSHAGVLILVLVVCAILIVGMILYKKDMLPASLTAAIDKLSGNTEEVKRTNGTATDDAETETQESVQADATKPSGDASEKKSGKANGLADLLNSGVKDAEPNDADEADPDEAEEADEPDQPVMTAEEILANAEEETEERFLDE